MHFSAYRKKPYEKFQAVSFCESAPSNLDFIRTLSSVYCSWLYEGHSLAGTAFSSGSRGVSVPAFCRRSRSAPPVDTGRRCCVACPQVGPAHRELGTPSVLPPVRVPPGTCRWTLLEALSMGADGRPRHSGRKTKCQGLQEMPRFWLSWGVVPQQFTGGFRELGESSKMKMEFPCDQNRAKPRDESKAEAQGSGICPRSPEDSPLPPPWMGQGQRPLLAHSPAQVSCVFTTRQALTTTVCCKPLTASSGVFTGLFFL